MVDEQYVWIVWAGAFLVPWVVLWAAFGMYWSGVFDHFFWRRTVSEANPVPIRHTLEE